VDDLGAQNRAVDRGVAFGADLGLRDLEPGGVFRLGRGDAAVNTLGQEFGVAIVGDQGAHGQLNSVESRFVNPLEVSYISNAHLHLRNSA